MSLKKIGEFNNISEELKKTIRSLKSGEEVVYELLDGEKDPESGKMYYGGTRTMNGRDTIIDPFTGSVVEIGIPRNVVGGVVELCKKFILDGGGSNGMVHGRFSLFGGRVEDEMWHSFFSLWNFNESNPNRDKSKPAVIRRIDFKEESKKDIKRRNVLRDALNHVRDITPDDIRMFAASLGWDITRDIELMRPEVESFAENFPDDYLKRISDPITKTKADIKTAMDESIIGFDAQKNSIYWTRNKAQIALLERDGDKTTIELFADWVANSKNGKDVFNNIVKQTKEVLKKKRGGAADVKELAENEAE